MATNKKSPNGINGTHRSNGHVSLAREEYDALMAREESFTEQVAENAKNTVRISELRQQLNDHARYMNDCSLKISHLERVNGLQAMLIDLLRDKDKIAGMADLSEFWRQWTIHTSNAVDKRTLEREEVAKFEPDLFKSWRCWIRDASKVDRMFNGGGSMTRVERDEALAKSPAEMQEHIIRRLREENAKLASKQRQLEVEIEQFKNNNKPQEDKRP